MGLGHVPSGSVREERSCGDVQRRQRRGTSQGRPSAARGVVVTEPDESATQRPAANQPSHADTDPKAPEPTEGRGKTPGTTGPDDEQPADTATEPTPGDSAGVTVNSTDSQLGSSEASEQIQSTDDMLSDEARERAASAGKSYDSAAWDDSAMTPDGEFRDRGDNRRH